MEARVDKHREVVGKGVNDDLLNVTLYVSDKEHNKSIIVDKSYNMVVSNLKFYQ